MNPALTDSKPLRIWHVTEIYPPDYGGGAAMYVREVCRAQASRGHEIRVLCTGNTELDAYSVQTDYDGEIRVDRLNLPYFRRSDPDGARLGLWRWKKHQRRIQQAVDQLLEDWRPDLVQFHTPRPIDDECLIAIQRHHLPTVGMLHCAGLICARLNLIQSPQSTPCSGPAPLKCLKCVYSNYDGSHQKAAIKLPWRLFKLGIFPAYRLWRRSVARRGVQGLIGVSEYITEIHRPSVSVPVQHVPLGIDLRGVSPLQPTMQSPARKRSTPLRFGFMAGFQPHKGIWHVLDACASLKREGLPFELHVWGPLQEGKMPEITARGLEENVFLHGLYAPEERWEIYRKMNVVVMATTVCETLGRVVMEAAAVGVPTIAPHVGGIPEMIRHQTDGLLYRFMDSADLEYQMRRVLTEPELLPQLTQNLQPVPDTRDAVAGLEDFYYKILDSRENKSR